MALLKENGSLDVERINNLPIEEYMDEMGTLTKEQVKEYLSRLPMTESQEPMQAVVVDYTLEEDIEGNGIVPFDDVLNKMKKIMTQQ